MRQPVSALFAVASLLLALTPAWPAAHPDAEACLACHGSEGAPAVKADDFLKSRHGALSCSGCHSGVTEYPHPDKVKKVDCASCHAAAAKAFKDGVHAKVMNGKRNACAGCHGTHAVKSPSAQGLSLCADCHKSESSAYAGSVHGRSRAGGDPDAATCFSCHGGGHSVRRVKDPKGPAHPANLPKTCAQCHSDPQLAERHGLPAQDMYKLYMKSTHGRSNALGQIVAANCASCHGTHDIKAHSDPKARVSGHNIAATCGKCHSGEARAFGASIHGRLSAAGERAAPTCTDCHGEHDITGPAVAGSRVAPGTRAKTCGDCHGSQRIASRFGWRADRVATFDKSFHGMAGRGGDVKAADCASCHGWHDVLPSADPKSRIHPSNLANTCGSCHPGAGQRWAASGMKVHDTLSREGQGSKLAAFAAALYAFFIPLTVAGMLGHNALDLWRKMRAPRRYRHRVEEVPLSVWERWQHAFNAVAFIGLAYSGFALQHPEAWWAAPFHVLGGEALRRNAHRAMAALFLLVAGAHLAYLASAPGRRRLLAMLPMWRDLKDPFKVLSYNVGATRMPPTLAQFAYMEKFEYWALVWGSFVMTATGALLFFHNMALAYLPLWVTEVARVVHYLEAVLACLAILIWHGYWVFLDPEVYPMNWAWLTGHTPPPGVKEENH